MTSRSKLSRPAPFASSFRSLAAVVALAALGAACSASPSSSGERTTSTSSRVIKGVASTDAQNAVVLMYQFDGSSAGGCTATLIAPNLLLTARHCVSKTDEGAECKADGSPINGGGGVIYSDYPASQLYVFTGTTAPDFSKGAPSIAAKGKQIITNGAKNLCNNDIALVLLDTPLDAMPIAQIRLDGPPVKGEKITSVGWGLTEANDTPKVRQQRANVVIEAVSTGGTPGLNLSPNEFEVGESICSGDSGGPALVQPSGAIIGVVSRGGNGQQPDENNPSLSCIDSSGSAGVYQAANIYTQVAPFKDFILAAFETAGHQPWLEGGPDPRLTPIGGSCTTDAECQGNVCVIDGGTGSCSQACGTDTTTCPDGFTCATSGDTSVCIVPKPSATNGANATASASGCSASSAPADSAFGVGLFFATFAVGSVLRRARRRART